MAIEKFVPERAARVQRLREPAEIIEVRVQVEAQSLGWSGRASVTLPVATHAYRSSIDPKLVDRRGAKPRPRITSKGK